MRCGRCRSRSPHGERGLKFEEGGEVEVFVGRSPHGERGLKFLYHRVDRVQHDVALLMESVD